MYIRIKEARKFKHMTVKDLSKVSGISERSINFYEKQRREPKLSRVERLAEVLEVDPAWLVSWKD